MFLVAISAAMVGLVHSLAPGHWLPVIMMSKAKRWGIGAASLGALVAASGHIALSVFVGTIGIEVGAHFLHDYELQVEKYAALAAAIFGLIYAGFAYFRHSACHGHTHHGPEPEKRNAPLLFLFSLGFSP